MKSKLNLVAALFLAAVCALLAVPAQASPTIALENGMKITGAQAAAVNAAVVVPLALAIFQHERCVRIPGCLPKAQKLVWTSGSGQPVNTSAGPLRGN